jgi:peptidoglycan hydrolase CwlO-like protein
MNPKKIQEKQAEAARLLTEIDSLAEQIKSLGSRYSQIQEEILQLEEEDGPCGPP